MLEYSEQVILNEEVKLKHHLLKIWVQVFKSGPSKICGRQL